MGKRGVMLNKREVCSRQRRVEKAKGPTISGHDLTKNGKKTTGENSEERKDASK